MKATERELRARLRFQHGLITTGELRLLGISPAVERRRVASGEWLRPSPTVIAVATAPATPEQALLAACLAAGASGVASHQSAAWLWDLARVPARHSISVQRGARPRVVAVDVHTLTDLPVHAVMRRGIPATNPLRTLVDFAAVADERDLDEATDRALALRLVTIEGIEAELGRLGRQGRRGVGTLKRALRRRGFVGAPHPSVLESLFLRLLDRVGIVPLGVEVVVGEDGRYRIDSLITEGLAVETDGYAYHSSPEQVSEDERRRRRIRASGIEVLVYTYRDVVYDGRRTAKEIAQTKHRVETRRRSA